MEKKSSGSHALLESYELLAYMLNKYIIHDSEVIINEIENFNNDNGQHTTIEHINELSKQYFENAEELQRIALELFSLDLTEFYNDDTYNMENITKHEVDVLNRIDELMKRIDNLDINPSQFINQYHEYKKATPIDNVNIQHFTTEDNSLKRVNHCHVEKNIKGRSKLHYKKASIFAAMLCIFIFGSCIGVMGNELYKVIIKRNNNAISVENNQNIMESDEEDAYQRIRDELGIRPIKLNYKPKECTFTSLDIDLDTKSAIMRFQYNNKKLSITQALSNDDLAETFMLDGKIIDNIKIKIIDNDTDIYEYVDEYKNHQYIVSIKIRNNFYIISSNVNKDTFIQIVENIIFYK